MGTKRTNRTIEDPLQRSPIPATHDRGYQSSEWMSREGRPQAVPSSRAEPERERETWRAREMYRILERPREGRREVDTDQRNRERFDAFKGRAEDIEWKERNRRREGGKHPNGGFTSVQDVMTAEFRERGREKGDTFPMTRKKSNEREKGKKYYPEQYSERGMERDRGRPREADVRKETAREIERAKRREMQRYRELEKQIEEVKRRGGRRGEKEESDRERDRGWDHGKREKWGERDMEVNDQRFMTGRETDRERDRLDPRDTDRERDRLGPRETDRERDRLGPRDRETDRERDRLGPRDRETDRERDRLGPRDRETDRERDRLGPRDRETGRERDRLGPRDRETDRERDRLGPRDRETDRERDRLGPRDTDRERDRLGPRDRETDRQKDRLNPRERETDRERDRLNPREREDGFRSAQRKRIMEGDRENFSDREEIDERVRVGRKHRHTKSEGDTDAEKEREVRRDEDPVLLNEGVRERERETERQRDRRKERETDTLGSNGRERDRDWGMEGYAERSKERDAKKRHWGREERGPDRQRDEVNQYRRRKKELNERQWRDGERERERACVHSSSVEREMDRYPERKQVQRRKSWEGGEAVRISRTLPEVWRTHTQTHSVEDTVRRTHTQTHSGEFFSGSEEENNQRRREMKERPEDEERVRTSEGSKERKKKIREEGQGVTGEEQEGEAREWFEKEEVQTERKGEREKPEGKQRPLKKMWLEPRSGTERTDLLLEEFKERERAREKYAQRYTERKASSDEEERAADRKHAKVRALLEDGYGNLETEFMKDNDGENMEERSEMDKDIEPEFIFTELGLDAPWQMEAENVCNDLEGSDRESDRGSDGYGDSEGREGSEGEWGAEGKERMMSGEDGFVTVSSGGDEEEAEEDKFEDCEEFWDGEFREDLARQRTHQREGEIETRMTKDRSDHTVTVFCVVGQPLPRSQSNQSPPMDHMEEEEANQRSALDCGGDREVDQDVAPSREMVTTEESLGDSYGTAEETTQKETDSTAHSLPLTEAEISSIHETGKAEDDNITKEITSAEDQEVTGNVSAEKAPEPHPSDLYDVSSQNREEGGAVEKGFQLDELRCAPEERKRQSAAPHLKWAKNVLHEILGSSDDGDLNVAELSTQSEQPSNGSHAEVSGQGDPASPLYSVVQKPRKHGSGRRCTDPELMQTRTDGTDTGGGDVARPCTKPDAAAGNKILILTEGESETVAEGLQLEEEFLEDETDEEAERDTLVPSADLISLSSEGETEKEDSSKKCEKQKKKGVWDILSSSSFRDLGNEARFKRRGFRKTADKRSEEEGGAGRDRRTRVFASESEYDELRFSWSEAELKQNILSSRKGTIDRTRMRNSKFYNSQLYQQYSEVVQNREILHQAHSYSSSGDVAASSSPCPSPPLARRPLPPLPPAPHHSLTLFSSLSGALAPPTPQRPSSPRLSRSFTSSPMLWQDLPGVRNSPELTTLCEDERRLQEVRFEVVTSEASYCSSLDIVVEHFVKSKQLNTLLTTQDKNWLFSRLCDVRAISHSFFSQLEERVESDILHFTVSDIIIKHCPRFRSVYVPYLTNQSYQDKTYQKLMNENIAFRHMVEKLEHSPKCQRLPFRSFLILPFQRITRLKLLVQNIVKRTAPKTKDEAEAIKAMKLLEKMIQESNDSISQMKSIESLVSLNAKVDFECKTLPLISQSRRLVREGPVTELRDFSLKETERSVYIHLFNDYLLVSLHKEGGRFTVIDHAPVSELRAENCRVKLHSLQKNLFRLHIGNKGLLLRTDTQADKLRWISALSRPHPEIDFTAAQDFPQMQCMRAFVAQQPDELSLEKADVLLVHQQSSDGWVEGTRLSDRHRGWVPESHLEIIVSEKARQCNLADTLKITTATATV